MKKIIVQCFLIVIVVVIMSGCHTNEKVPAKEKKFKEEIGTMKILINNDEYLINLENNETAQKLASLLPLELTMKELNGNEKYVYLKESLPTNSSNPKHINVGDVMLYGDNCLVIFYKSFDTSYKYTKIGYIDNLHNIGDGDIKVIIDKY